MIWKIIAPKPGWVQLVMWKKYFRGQRLRCLEWQKENLRSPLSNLISKVRPHIRDIAYWIPGNGKLIKIWEDNIMNIPPLVNLSLRRELKTWMDEANIKSLWDISTWHDDSWAGQRTPNIPAVWLPEYIKLLQLLHGATPTHAKKKDLRGCGEKQFSYSVAQGYAKIKEGPHVPPNLVPWNSIQNLSSIPKIDFFCWLLCHQKIVTEDRLQKRGFLGPSRCALCKENFESVVHISLNCKFTVQVQQDLLGMWKSMPILPHVVPNLFDGWLARYPGPSPKNKIAKLAWTTLPKFISWQTQLERNRRIFRDKEQNYKVVANTIKGQLNEWLSDKKDDTNLSQDDIEFEAALNLSFQKSIIPLICLKDWQIRKNKEDFQAWLFNQAIPSLFFDRVAKGNPGRAGVGGIIINPKYSSTHRFAWGLGHTTSIQAEVTMLFQGIKMLKALGLTEATVLGDSQVIINAMVTKTNLVDLRLARTI